MPLKLSEIMPDLFPENSQISFSVGQQLDYAVVKINSSWSKTMSISSLVIADLRAINEQIPHHKIISSL
jgi:hypothetical protein